MFSVNGYTTHMCTYIQVLNAHGSIAFWASLSPKSEIPNTPESLSFRSETLTYANLGTLCLDFQAKTPKLVNSLLLLQILEHHKPEILLFYARCIQSSSDSAFFFGLWPWTYPWIMSDMEALPLFWLLVKNTHSLDTAVIQKSGTIPQHPQCRLWTFFRNWQVLAPVLWPTVQGLTHIWLLHYSLIGWTNNYILFSTIISKVPYCNFCVIMDESLVFLKPAQPQAHPEAFRISPFYGWNLQGYLKVWDSIWYSYICDIFL